MKTAQIIRRRARVRAKITGTVQRPRLAVRITNRHVIAQLIDDESGRSLAQVTTSGSEVGGNMTQKATWAGQQIAAAAKKHKIKMVVFDRGRRIYHGRLHALAEAARSQGLEF